MRSQTARVAIVDFGMGNLYSVQRACDHAGLSSRLVTTPEQLRAADAAILPGVGAMPDAMRSLTESGLAEAVREFVGAGRPLFGICLGLQLLMSDGSEFGPHKGLGIIAGSVTRFPDAHSNGRRMKVPQVGWNAVDPVASPDGLSSWEATPLGDVPSGTYMYFVHSYYVQPDASSVRSAETSYGNTRFCSAIHKDNVFGCQFHPERSGPLGLRIYRGFAQLLD